MPAHGPGSPSDRRIGDTADRTGSASRAPLLGTRLLAWRNLSHDRARCIATLIGVGFALAVPGIGSVGKLMLPFGFWK
jgi:hypothetical protein